MNAPLTPERLAEIRAKVAYNDGSHGGRIRNRVEEDLLAEVDRLRAQVANLLDLFTYVPINDSSRRLTALYGDADVTEEVRAALASGEQVQS